MKKTATKNPKIETSSSANSQNRKSPRNVKEWSPQKGDMFINRLFEVSGKNTNAALADDLGIDAKKISEWRNGKGKLPDVDDLLIIARKYRCSIDYLLEIDVKSKNSGAMDDTNKTLADIAGPLIGMLEDDDCFIFNVDADKKTCKDFDSTAGSGLALGFYNATPDSFHTSYIQKFLKEFNDVWHIRNSVTTGNDIYKRWKENILDDYSHRLRAYLDIDGFTRDDWQYKTKYEIAYSIFEPIFSFLYPPNDEDDTKNYYVSDDDIEYLIRACEDDDIRQHLNYSKDIRNIRDLCEKYKKQRDDISQS